MPPPLTPHDGARILLAWSCRSSPTLPSGATTAAVSLSQPVNGQSIPLAFVSCAGYGNVVLTVGTDLLANTLHYGAYNVTMDASGDAPWTLVVEQSLGSR